MRNKTLTEYLWKLLEAVLIGFTIGVAGAIIWNRQNKTENKPGMGEIDGL